MPLGEQVGIGVIAGIARDGGDGEGEKVVAADEVKMEVDQWIEVIAGIAREDGDGEVEKVVAADEVKMEVDQWR